MRSSRGHKAAAAAVLIAAALLAASVVSPAVGGPSISRVYKTAKKAYKTARTANKRAKRAQRAASTAAVRDVSVTVDVPPGGEVYTINCPRGYAPVGWGAIPVSGVDSFVIGASPVNTGYLIGAYSTNGEAGVIYDVTCVRSATSGSARLRSRLDARKARAALEAELAERRR